jgi:hypothetical protein
MKKIFAVAMLDLRRLSFGLASGSLLAGLLPSLASGLGAKPDTGVLVAFVLVVAGIAAGTTFGNDFADGKSSFFFARPLPTGVLIVGRFGAFLALTAMSFFLFMASAWVSSSERSEWSLWVLSERHVEVVLTAWALSLFVSLAVAVRGRGVRVDGGLKAMLIIPIRLVASMVAFLLVFGLFADLILRAYFNNLTPIRAFLLSWVAASFVASCVAIAYGRTERLRISKLQGQVMAAHFTLVSLIVFAAWGYVLHPGPEAIKAVKGWAWGGTDGRSVMVATEVDRGDGKTFSPIFIVDVASGQAQRLNSDPFAGPWLSADGATLVWSEATPFFFRPLWRRLGGETTYRVKTASGAVSPLPLPVNYPDFRRVRDLTDGDTMNRVLPSPEGEIFAIGWGGHLTFTSRSRGEMADLKQVEYKGAGVFERLSLSSAAFLPSGELRTTRTLGAATGPQAVSIVDIDPRSGTTKVVTSVQTEGPVFSRMDAHTPRLLLTSQAQPGHGASLWLVDGRETNAGPQSLMQGVLAPGGEFLADGRVAITYGGSPTSWNSRGLRILSDKGQLIREIPIGDGPAPYLDGEMFPGILALSIGLLKQEVTLVDIESGAVVRRLADMRAFRTLQGRPGSPAARLMVSKDGKLFELPSPTAEPRQLLPLTGR